MRSLLPLALVASLGACAVPDAATDYAGNLYPPECPASIVSDPQWLSRMDFRTANIPQYGLTTFLGPRPVVIVNSRLSGWLAADIRRHEMCHAVMHLLGKPADWHPGQNDYYANPRPQDLRGHGDPFHN